MRSIDAITVHEAGRRSASDVDHIAWALDNERVIVTHDDDYLVLAARVERHAGIAFCKADKYNLGGLLREIEALETPRCRPRTGSAASFSSEHAAAAPAAYP